MLSTKLKQTSLRRRTSYGNLHETSVIMARDKRHKVGQALTSRHEIMFIHPQDVVGYIPTINAPATEMTTVKEILCRSDEIRKTLDLWAIVVVMDQALFAKAAEVAWKENDRYGSIILQLGTFHTIFNLLSIIG